MEDLDTQDVNQENPEKSENFLTIFDDAIKNLLDSYGNTFHLLADKLFNIKLIFIVVKGYIKDLIKNPDDEDMKQGITDETNNYKENVEEVQRTLIVDNKDFQALTKNANKLKNFEVGNPQISNETYNFFIDTRHKLDTVLNQLNEFILVKQITFCNKIISIVQRENPDNYPILEEVFTKAISNLERAFKLVNEGHAEIKKIKGLVGEFQKKLEDKIEVMEVSDSDEALDEYLEGMEGVLDKFSEDDELADDASLEDIQSASLSTKRGKEAGIEVIVRTSGVYLKLIPSFDGKLIANLDEIKAELEARKIDVPSDDILENIIQAEHDQFFKIGEWTPDPQNDARVTIQFNDNKTEAYIIMEMPKFNGRIAEKRDVVSLIKEFGIKHGIDEDAIDDAIQQQIYGKPILIAKGEEPSQGKDAKINYNFRTDFHVKEFKEDEYGRVDFKNLDLIQNIFAGQLLAEMQEPTEGTPGKNVCGEEIPAEPGRQIQFQAGNNVSISEDGKQALADINGHVYLSGGLINVDPIYTVEGNVDYNTGNIEFLGTVVVKGDIFDGFSIKADGDIQIQGMVGNCTLKAKNDIMLSSGINGKSSGSITAGGKIISKFIENTEYVKASDDIIVENNILHSYIESKNNIICTTNKGLIAGGKVIAGKEIEANILGTASYSPTVLIVGVDRDLEKQREKLQKDMYYSKIYLVKIKRVVSKLKNKKNKKGYLTPLWKEISKNVIERRTDEEKTFKRLLMEHKQVSEQIEMIRKGAGVKSHNQVYPKVTVYIGPLSFSVKNELGKIQFALGDKKVLLKPFTEEGTKR